MKSAARAIALFLLCVTLVSCARRGADVPTEPPRFDARSRLVIYNTLLAVGAEALGVYVASAESSGSISPELAKQLRAWRLAIAEAAKEIAAISASPVADEGNVRLRMAITRAIAPAALRAWAVTTKDPRQQEIAWRVEAVIRAADLLVQAATQLGLMQDMAGTYVAPSSVAHAVCERNLCDDWLLRCAAYGSRCDWRKANDLAMLAASGIQRE